jgi:hypothetical protein
VRYVTEHLLAAPLTLSHCAGSASAERRLHVPQQHRKQCLSTATTAGAVAASSACAPAARRCISSAGNASAAQRLHLSLSSNAGNASGADDLKRSTVHITTLWCDCGIVHCTCCGTANHIRCMPCAWYAYHMAVKIGGIGSLLKHLPLYAGAMCISCVGQRGRKHQKPQLEQQLGDTKPQ